ncbi:hypothetical protein dsx2_1455 [Desulfovibrio sp. X2]|uniref:hypothetical protein n=1 Tax=Desulfovibrio sp. X2 TaxID=941449 RepID=UPI000358A951|nr:hypothetical protein [Desulfovibrio sp. X2]EPR44496.1 hypothetical protein dsx2_1455 [Desulfovibrio sp. X2]
MRKHLFAKTDCNCLRKATYFKCVFCGCLEYLSVDEIRRMDRSRAECPDERAPRVPSQEAFLTGFGGTVDCLAPDWQTHYRDAPPDDCPNCPPPGKD